jgi:hypothetical protein
MPIKDLVPSSRGRELSARRDEETTNPFLTLHREMNRLFDEARHRFERRLHLIRIDVVNRDPALEAPVIDVR